MALFDSLQQLNEERKSTTRRRFLFSSVLAGLSYVGYRWWRFRARPLINRATKFITSNREFYLESIDKGFRPNISSEDWRLEIVSPTGAACFLSYDELLKLESFEVHKTFVCVGNEAGGPAMGNALWTGTRLAPLLDKALGEYPRAGLRVMFHALDGFYSSVPLELALSSMSFLAYKMNGESLPLGHGFPARVLLPGIYGMKQPRWLSKIEILETPWIKGYWEARGYCDECNIKMTARIDSVAADQSGKRLVTGVAICGMQKVGKVEISFDNGRKWQPASITSEILTDAWVTWEAQWEPVEKGEQVLSARVIAESGERQDESNSGSFPSGSTGLHRVTVNI